MRAPVVRVPPPGLPREAVGQKAQSVERRREAFGVLCKRVVGDDDGNNITILFPGPARAASGMRGRQLAPGTYSSKAGLRAGTAAGGRGSGMRHSGEQVDGDVGVDGIHSRSGEEAIGLQSTCTGYLQGISDCLFLFCSL